MKQFARRGTSETYIKERNTGRDRGRVQPQQRAALDWWFGPFRYGLDRKVRVHKTSTVTGRYVAFTEAEKKEKQEIKKDLIQDKEREARKKHG